MITRPAAFRLFGEPAPKGSLAGRVNPKNPKHVIITEDANRNRPWRRAIEKAAPVHITERPDPHQPLKVTLLFGITRTRAAADREFPSTQSAQGIGGDLDKLVRLVLDALESCGILTNDAQVVELEASKVYADTVGRGPGMYCRVEPVGYVPPELPYADKLLPEDGEL